jgi:hypothetical protein
VLIARVCNVLTGAELKDESDSEDERLEGCI